MAELGETPAEVIPIEKSPVKKAASPEEEKRFPKKPTTVSPHHQPITRRELLRRGLNLGLLFAGTSVVGKMALDYDDVFSRLAWELYDGSIKESIDFFKKKYCIDIATGNPPNEGRTTGDKLNRYEMARGLKLVTEEIVKYPPDFFRNNDFHTIRFLKSIHVAGMNYGGGYGGDGEIGIEYDADLFEMKRGYVREVFHHELYHSLDYDLDNDDIWRNIHGQEDAYKEIWGRGADKKATSPKKWFSDGYGQGSPWEDQAQFGMFLMIPDKHKRLLKRINREKDPETKRILQTKYDLTKGYYLQWSNGLMNDQYWQDLLSNKVKYGYFPKAPE